MTYQPVVPISGYAGWRFLNRTLDMQKQAFEESSTIVRKSDYFRENITKIKSAEELVGNRRLLEVALGAFGLDDDINNKFYIEKVLSEGTINDDSLANKLSDKRYAAFSEAFGFGNMGGAGRVRFDGFADEILEKYDDRQFELAVGEQDNSMRLALNMPSALDEVLSNSSTIDGQWFSLMGNTPIRTMFETALGFSSSFGSLDIDLQLSNFKERSESVFGTSDLSEFQDSEMQEKLTRLFLVQSEINAIGNLGSNSIALTLLQSAPRYY
ncbi:DUF1217 domain-containing protein [Aestuariibius sp. HNIBRBA575]|uniref:DUF1217 domain-containing protein n=1 Tax=Aestuariibius sp. HNIBRBA575 TaxID=3233343 RepID=UPI0034A3E52B